MPFINIKNIRLYWLGFIMCLCAYGIHKQASEHVVIPINTTSYVEGRAIPPLFPHDVCAKNTQCKKLTEALVFEARGESTKGMAAIAHVILNRKEDPRWPSRVVDVIHQPHQFSYLKDMHKQKSPTKEDWNKARKVAYGVLYGHISSPVGDATYYHAKHVRPNWAKKLERVAVIGQHIFYK